MTTENNNIQNDDFQYNEKYDEKLMDHDYDGIKELDNPPPAWIMAIFYITITFSVFYGAYYFWFGQGPNQEQEYQEMNKEYEARFGAAQKSVEKLILLTDDASLSEGAKIYKDMGCAACHGANGEGNAIGPNLTDHNWINGCSFDEVFNIIKNGKATKGMTAFKAQLNDKKIQQVASYVLVKLKDSNPANAKEPQGEECN